MKITTFNISNSQGRDLVLYFEPWAEELLVKENESISISMSCSTDEVLEVEVIAKGIVIYGSLHSIVRVYRNNVQIWESYNYISPDEFLR
jgi:hypothetical protein